ncbi:MAG: aminopeptidase P family protein [Nitrososphaerota archaeon]|nr:aminopeptidase P family protein [Nitrososphaerota archaeon]MDG6922671.1 aminopeptidase P family protein [Nitrososphaerota archaeon]
MRGVVKSDGGVSWVAQPKQLLDNLRQKCPFDRFSPEEYQRRWDKSRRFMEAHDVEALIVAGGNQSWQKAWTNVRYLTEYVGSMELNLFVVLGSKDASPPSVCGVGPAYAHRMARAVVDDLRSGPPGPLTATRLKELGITSGKVGVVESTGRMPRDIWDSLRSSLPNVEFEFLEKSWWKEVRLPLSREEIEWFKKAGVIGDSALNAIIEKAKPGMTEDEVFGTIVGSEISNGGENEMMMLIGSHSMLDPDADDTSARPRDRVLMKGDIILTEIGPSYNGYEGQVGRPITLGPPTQEYKQMLDLALEVYGDIVKNLKPGRRADAILKAGDKIDEAGYKNGGPPLIHALPSGLLGNIPSIPQRSQLGTWRLRYGEADFEEFTQNMPVCVEVSLVRKDEMAGVFLCNSFIINDDAPIDLYRTPMQIYVK